MKIKNSDSNVIGEMKGQFTVVSNYGESVVDMKAVTYAPESPDVWEKAEVVTSYPYLSTPDFDKIYNNYYLPGNTQDGPDAVYKLTVTEPTTLAVGVNGANAKMALYPEGFNGKGGPDVANNYGATIDPDQQEPEFPEVEMPEVQGNSFSFDFNDGKMDGCTLLAQDAVALALVLVIADQRADRGQRIVLKQQATGLVQLVCLQQFDNLRDGRGDGAALLALGYLAAKAAVRFFHNVQRHIITFMCLCAQNSPISYIIVPRISAGGKSNSRLKDGVRDGDGEAAQKSPRALNGYADFGVIHFRLPHPFSATGTAPAPCCPHIHRGRCC